MKFLQEPHLATLCEALTNIDCGTCVFNCAVEAFSCKPVKDDKKLLKRISREFSNERIIHRMADNKVQEMNVKQMKASLDKAVETPVGNIQNAETQRLVTDLISTLNQAHPNADFSRISPHSFDPIPFKTFTEEIESHLCLLRDEPDIVGIFWTSIKKSINFTNCEVYGYRPEVFGRNILWEEHYFIVNKKEKKLVYIYMEGSSKMNLDSSEKPLNVNLPTSPALGSMYPQTEMDEDSLLMPKEEYRIR